MVRDLAWHGSRFTVAIGQATTTVSRSVGRCAARHGRRITRTVAPGGTLTLPTRRPDLKPTTDMVRCQPATASSAQPGADPWPRSTAARPRDWQPQQITASVDRTATRETAVIRSATLEWGQAVPAHRPRPTSTRRRTSARRCGRAPTTCVVSADGTTWTVAATGSRYRTTGTRDVLTFPPVHARYVRVQITAATYNTPPMLEEITVP